MSIFICDQLFEPLRRDIIDMDFTCDHSLDTLEFACSESKLDTLTLVFLLTCDEGVDDFLELLIIVCKRTHDCDFFEHKGKKQDFHLHSVSNQFQHSINS
jgi:hypothetical protein